MLLEGGENSSTDARNAIQAQADMAAEYASFTGFRTRIDELIRTLKGSSAGPTELAQDQLTRTQFGGGSEGWIEAAGLFTAYETVISELENLSKLLSDSMEGMGIAVLASHKGYENIDLDVRQRMAAISAETTKEYGGVYDPGQPQQSATGQPPSGNATNTKGGAI
ncbi:hypothetical protein ACSCBZ_45400 [Streptomyces niveiscabiei]|uniref:hypothetical protein n=1 Tax=Streptomyces TaxID=1883 RepID=UPI0006EB49AF|nr:MULTISPECIES: hypothetical protein [Streptomyces]